MLCSRIAIVGAGVSGLSCARALQAAGCEVVVLEKSRSLGGRVASRTWENCRVDHGAPYFSAQNEDFRREVIEPLGDDWRELTAPILDEAGQPILEPPQSRLYGMRGNNQMGRFLAEDVEVRRETPVTRLEPQAGGWLVDGQAYDAVVSCAPWPQTAALLGDDAGAQSEGYQRAWTVFLRYDGAPTGPTAEIFGRRWETHPDLIWSGVENHKEGRIPEGKTVLVVHSTDAFARAHWETEKEDVAYRLAEIVAPHWELPARPEAVFAHRWKFSRQADDADLHGLELPPGLAICGDSLTGSTVEAVWLDGRRCARRVLEMLSSTKG